MGGPGAVRSGARALLVSELFPPAVGGSAVLMENIYSRLAAADVVVLTDAATPVGRDERRGRLGIVRTRIATRRWGFVDPRALAHHLLVARAIRALGPRRRTVVHCARALPEGVGALLSRLLFGAPYTCWAHGEDIATASTSRELTFLTKCVFAGAAAALANSRSTARMLESLGIDAGRIHVVHPGVDAARFRPAADRASVRKRFAPRNELLLLSVGRLQRRKGHDLVLRALAGIGDSLGPVRYVVIGDGGERGRLEGLRSELGLGDRVHFAGEVPPDELPDAFAAADIFLLPNRIDGADVEGFGIVFLEAAASGVPSIGGSSGGVPEAVLDGRTGLLVSGEDPGELARAIRKLGASPELRRELGAAGRSRVLDEFTWARAAREVDEVHERIAAASRARACCARS